MWCVEREGWEELCTRGLSEETWGKIKLSWKSGKNSVLGRGKGIWEGCKWSESLTHFRNWVRALGRWYWESCGKAAPQQPRLQFISNNFLNVLCSFRLSVEKTLQHPPFHTFGSHFQEVCRDSPTRTSHSGFCTGSSTHTAPLTAYIVYDISVLSQESVLEDRLSFLIFASLMPRIGPDTLYVCNK